MGGTGAGAQAPSPAQEPPPAAVRLDQLGFETHDPKRAGVVTAAVAPLAWTVTDVHDVVVARGLTTPFGAGMGSGVGFAGAVIDGLRSYSVAPSRLGLPDRYRSGG